MWAFSSASATNTSFRILVRCFCISHSSPPLTTTTLATKASPFKSIRFGALSSMDNHNINNFSSFSAASARSRPSGDSGRGKGLETRDDRQRSGGRSRGGGAPKDKIDALGRLLTRILRNMASELNLDMRSDGYVKVQDLLKLNLKTFANIPMRSHSVDDHTGYKSTVIQDVPISKPLSMADVTQLQATLDMAQDIPQTLVQFPDLHQLQGFVDRLKHVGDLLNISITKYGDLHLQVYTNLVTLELSFASYKCLVSEWMFHPVIVILVLRPPLKGHCSEERLSLCK